MPSVGLQEILFVGALALLFLGPEGMLDVLRSTARLTRTLTRMWEELEEEIRKEE